MEKEIGREQEKWQTLVESKAFDQLSTDEVQFVLAHGTQERYEITRRAILEMGEEDTLVPRPLVLETERKGLVVSIPLYQALLATAAAFVLGFFLLQPSNGIQEKNASTPLAGIDTVYIDKNTTDTLIKIEKEIVNRYVQAENASHANEKNPIRKETNAGIFGGTAPHLPDLASMELENKGSTASEDSSFSLIEGFMTPLEQ